MLVVQKYGGTSVGTPARIRRVAGRIAARHAAGDRLVVVVSAMGHSTDRLTTLARRVTASPSRREMDMLLTAGERISMSLLSMALHARGVPAISFTGSQSGIITDNAHTRARILDVRPIRILPELESGKVVIVAGFQGVSLEKEITTLGRGGSDTTAVALAAGLGAGACEIYTDVSGVMTADPRVVPGARLLPRVSWDAMLEMTSCGAGVMHTRAVELARRHRVPFEVRSSFHRRSGSVIQGEPLEGGGEVAAVSGRPQVAEFELSGLRLDVEGRAPFFEAVDALLEDVAALHETVGNGQVTVRFHAPQASEAERVRGALDELARRHGGTLRVETGRATVSLVGTGLIHAPRLAARAHRALARAGVDASSVVAAPMTLTFLIPAGAYAQAQAALHEEFVGTESKVQRV